MKARRENDSIKIPVSRWLAYAGAGVATALGGATAADAEIHYSGKVDASFRPDERKTLQFPLDQEGNFFSLEHYLTFSGVGHVFFGVKGVVDEGVRAVDVIEYYLMQRLGTGYISNGNFLNVDEGTLYGFGRGLWLKRGTSFVGFRFDNGAGFQYGWARIQYFGQNRNFAFKVLDYAYADPGEPIRGGQTSTAETNEIPEQGSLGFLALGAAGLALWRQRRERSSR